MIPIELSNIWMVDSAWSIMKSILITYSTINLEYLIFMLYVICVMPWLLNENEIRHNSTHKKKLVFNSFLCFYLFFFPDANCHKKRTIFKFGNNESSISV